MKKILLGLALAAATTVAIVHSPVGDFVTSAIAAESSDAARVTLAIDGLDCGSCSVKLRKALQRIPGVLEVKPGEEKAYVVVAYDDQRTSPEAIVKVVRKEGLTARIANR